MKLNRINKKGLKRIAAYIILPTCLAAAIDSCVNSGKEEDRDTIVKEHGFTNSDIYFGSLNEENSDYSFSLANCGNYKIGMSAMAQTLLSNETLPTGIVINSTATTLAQMYFEIDYVKSLIAQYDVNYPVFLNVDTLYEMKENDKMKIYEMVNVFYNKLVANGLYVGIMGTKEHLASFTNIIQQDKLVVLNDDVLHENEEYSMALIDGDTLVSSVKFDRIIDSLGFNNPEHFVMDYSYIPIDGNTVYSLTAQADIDSSVFCEYNAIQNPEYITTNEPLIFPNIYGKDAKVKTMS